MSTMQYHQMLVSPAVGGGARLALELHKHVTSIRGPVSQLLLPAGGDAERMARTAGYAFAKYRLDRLTGQGRLGTAIENLRLYYQTFPHRCGLVHVHAPYVYGAARLFLRKSRFLKVLHIHLDFTAEQLRWSLQYPPDLVLVCADFMRSTVERAVAAANGSNTTIRVIRNAVDLERYHPADRQGAKGSLGIPGDALVSMVVGNLEPHNGQDAAVRTVAVLKSEGLPVRLIPISSERDDNEGYMRELQALSWALAIESPSSDSKPMLPNYCGLRISCCSRRNARGFH